MTDTKHDIGGFHVDKLNEDICLRLVQSNGRRLLQMPRRFRTVEIKLAAVKSFPNIILLLNSSEITGEMYRMAVEKNPKLLKHLPENIKAYSEYLSMWRNNIITFADMIKKTPTDQLSKLYHQIVLMNPENIKAVPVLYRTRSMCYLASSLGSDVLMYIPREYLDQEMYNSIATNNPHILSYIPEKYRTRDMCFNAINNGLYSVLNYIPKEYLDQEMYDVLVRKKYITIEKIPTAFLTENIINTFVDRDPKTLLKISTSVITKEIVMRFALTYSGFELAHVPEQFLDSDIYTIYASKSAFDIKIIPKKYWTESMILSYIKWNDLHLDSVPKHLQTELIKFALLLNIK